MTSNISFTGRYAVLTFGNTRIGVSSKIPRRLREEYKEKLKEHQNREFGIIVRTNAKDVPFSDVLHEIEKLEREAERVIKAAPSRVCFSCLKSAPPSYITDLRNVYMEGMEEIIVSERELYEEVRS